MRRLDDAEAEVVLAESLPKLRRALLDDADGVVLQVDRSDEAIAFASSARAPEVSQIGAPCPDHLIHTKHKPLVVAFATNGAYSTAARELCQRLARATNQELLDITGRLACTFAAASWDAVVLCHPIVTHSVPLAPITSTQHSRITPSSAIPTQAS